MSILCDVAVNFKHRKIVGLTIRYLVRNRISDSSIQFEQIGDWYLVESAQ